MRDADEDFTHDRETGRSRGDRSVTAACLMRSGSVWARLETEWERLAASVEYREALRVWASREPAVLGCFDSIDELVQLAASPVLAIADPLWLALLRQARHGDSISDPAVRLVAHLMVPRAARLAASMRRAGHVGEEVDQAVVAALLTAIAAFPVRRRRSCVAANLTLDMLILAGRDISPAVCMAEEAYAPGRFDESASTHPVFTHRRTAAAGEAGRPSDDQAELRADYFHPANVGRRLVAAEELSDPDAPLEDGAAVGRHPAYGAGGMAAAEELARVLLWAVRSEVISVTEAQFLADSTRTDDPSNTAGRADTESSEAGGRHVSLEARRRRNHILARLRAAVAEGYDPDRSWPRSDEPVWHRRPA